MRLTADYHIHSNNSKFKISKISVEEIARKANSLGLKEVAVSDHGYKHFFACNKSNLFEVRKKINELNLSMGTKVLLGFEADIISSDGTLDIDDQTLEIVDVLIIGYHKMIKTDFASIFGGQKKSYQAIQLATDAYINAINRYDVSIVAHAGCDLKLDLLKLGEVCAKNGVLFELNNKHLNYNEKDIENLIKSGCSFVVSSDAYKEEDIGRVDKVFDFIKKYNIPPERIVNVEFEEDYKNELDLEIEDDLSRYREIIKEKYGEANESQLSDETEEELRKIALQKGIVGYKYDEIEPVDIMTEKEKQLIERAKEFLRTHKDD